MGHHHDHDSEQGHSPLAFPEKAVKLLSHWIQHNEEHARSYDQWAHEFRLNGFDAAATLLETAARLTAQVNHAFIQAAESIKPRQD